MKRRLAILLLCLVGSGAWAQQRPLFTQYTQNLYLQNPAFAGSEDFLDLKSGYRNHWTQLDNASAAPRTYYLSGHLPLNKYSKAPAQYDTIHYMPARGYSTKGQGATLIKARADSSDTLRRNKYWHGLGANVLTDRFGPQGLNAFRASYAFHYNLFGDAVIALGANAGFMNHRLRSDELEFSSNGNDPDKARAGAGTANNFLPDLSLGLSFYSPHYYLGVGATQLTQSGLSVGEFEGEAVRHYFFTGGLRLGLNDKWELLPSANARLASGELSLDGTLRALYDEQIWGGVSYRPGAAVAAQFGMKFWERLTVGYSFDLTTTEVIDHHLGGHEIVLGYQFGPNQSQNFY